MKRYETRGELIMKPDRGSAMVLALYMLSFKRDETYFTMMRHVFGTMLLFNKDGLYFNRSFEILG